MKSILLITLILFLHSENLKSQLSQEWIRSYNSTVNGNDEALAHVMDISGNVYSTGKILGSGTGFDIYTVKYSSSGDLLWEKIYNGPGNGNDIGYSIAVDADGSVYVAGESRGIDTQNDFILVKYNLSGIEQWNQRYNGASNSMDIAEKVVVDNSGNVILAGTSWELGVLFDAVTIKFNSSGSLQWKKSYNGTSNSHEFANDVAADSQGNVYVSGSTFSQATSNDYLLIKYSSGGNELWMRTYNGTGGAHDNNTSLIIDPAGDVIISGQSLGQGTNSDIATIKYSPGGDTIWQRRYTTQSVDIEEFKAITCDQSGNITIAATSTGFGSSYDYLTLKYSSKGDELWARNYNGPSSINFDESSSITADNFGNVYVAGFSAGTGTMDDMAIIKYDFPGHETWVSRFNAAANRDDRARSISVDANGNVYVSGMTTGPTSGTDFCVIKFSQLTSISSNVNSAPSGYVLNQNYPNPFNPVTNISYTLPQSHFVSVKIFDAQGKQIGTFVNEVKSAGNHSFQWNATEVSSGVYFYQLIADGFIDTRAMIVIK